MNILVLGGAGFLGTNLVRKLLLDKKNRILVVDSLDKRFQSSLSNLKDIKSSFTFIKGDIRSATLMNKMVKNSDVIYNCAAQTSHPLSLTDPLLDASINCLGNITLLESIKNHNKNAKIIYVSSSTVVGKYENNIIDEESSERPLDIYSANKGAAEKYYYIYGKVHGLKTLVLRFANLYGPYGKDSSQFGFINYFIALASQNKEIPIFGTGHQIRNIMYVEDACDLLTHVLKFKKLENDIYFAVNNEYYSVITIAKTIVSVFEQGRIKKIKWPAIRRKIEINKVNISGVKLGSQINWKPQFNLKSGLLKTKQIMETL